MTEKYITYKVNGEKYNIPESLTSGFEKKYPSATIEMHVGDDIYNIPPKHKDGFLSKYSDASYAFEMNDAKQEEEKPQPSFMPLEEESSSLADIIRDEDLSWRERRKAIRQAKYVDDTAPNAFQTIGKSTGAAGVTTAKMGVDAVNVGAKMGRKRAIANNPLTGLAATIEMITGKSVLDEDNPLNKVSENLGDAAERLSKEADPTGGEMGFGELMKHGHIGLAMQKALGSGIESAPIMLATKNPYTAGLYVIGAAASNYEDATRDNPEIPEWKRGVNAVGSAALEMAVEKIADIPWKYFGKAGGEITDDIARNVIDRVREEGVQTIASRIKRVIGNTAKDSISEGWEEVLTSFGNDALGSALDAIDGNSDYGIKAQWEEFKEQNPDATEEDFAWAKGKEYFESFLGGALSSIYIAGLGNTVKETREAKARSAFDNAFVSGANLDYNDMYDTNDDVNIALENAVSASKNQNGEETLTRGFIENLSAEEAFALSRSEDVKPKLRAALANFAEKKATQDGLNGKLTERTDSDIINFTNKVNEASENGKIVSAIHNNRTVFVNGGIVNADGTLTLPNGQHGPVIVIDGDNKYPVNSKEITDAWSQNTDEYIRDGEQSFRDRDAYLREWALNTMGPKAKRRAVEQYVGKKILINTENGGMTQVEVQAILPSGQVLVKGKKGDLGGQSERLFGSSAFYDAIARNDDGSPVFVEDISQQQTQTPVENTQTQQQHPVVPSEPQDFRESEQVILIDNKPTTVEVTNQDDAADRVTYTYIDETGARRTGSTTISGFAEAIKQAEAETAVEVSSETLSNEASQDAVGEFPAVPEGGVPTVPDMSSTPVSSTEVNAPIFPSSDVHNEIPLQKPKGRKDEEEENVELTAEDINWDALFEQDTEAYFAELQKQFGEGAADVINMEIAATQKELDKLEKNQGATRTERVKNIGKIAKLRLEKGILEDMANRLQRKNEPISETAEVTETEQVVTPEVAATESITEPIDNSAEIEIPEPRQIPLDKKNSEPINGVELAANELGKKQGIKLLWDSVQRHTGYGDGEKKKFFGLFRTKEKGGMDLETAGERLMEIDREYGFNFFDQNDPNAGMNAILEALGANSTVVDLRSYTARMRQAEAQEYENAAYKEAMERFYEERGESYDDYKAYNEQLRDELKSGYALSDEQLNEYNATLAEEYDRYDRERNATENEQGEDGPVRTTEDIGDLPLAEGEAHGGSEGSNQVLRETQTVQQGGDRHAEGGRPSVGVSAQDAGIPVHGTEEGESVSTLDEDMPDFTTEAPKAPVAPKSVDNPIAEAQKREDSLISQLSREEIPFKQRQDLAYNAGKAVADFFATREEYDAYEEVAADLGEFIEDFDRGVEASFANRDNQYQISDDNLSVTSEAQQLAVDALMETLDGYVDTVIATDEQTKEVLALGGIENQFSIETDKPIFISNAALAVQGIKMEKATPEQWLKMIEKAGGLKAGEDKWMRLSDWLKASDKKTLTKQEVLDYINANTIQIEEVNYSANAEENAQDTMTEIERRLKEKFDGYISEYYEEHDIDDIFGTEASDYAIEKLREEMGDTTYPYTIENSGSDVWVVFTYEEVDELQDWANRLGISFTPEIPSNSLRLNYTTDGLRNKKEIALVVPTIESWKNYDEVHFGDAGDGRAVVWVRFGDTVGYAPEYAEFYAYQEEMQKKYFPDRATHSLSGNDLIALTPKEKAEFERLRSIKNQIPYSQSRNRKILVIDEIQSKRHQDGREKGYSMTEEEYNRRLEALETEQADRLRRRTNLLRVLKEKYGDDFRVYLKSENTAYVPNRDVMTPEEVKEWNETSQEDIYDAIDALQREKRTGVPAAPFEKNWSELALKRMLRYAAENGYDAIAWTTGNQQSDRYNLAKSFDSIEREDNPNVEGRRFVLSGNNTEGFQVDENGNILGSTIEEARGKTLADVVGKDMADKMMSLENGATIEGEELRIGGEGMKGFYDKMLPAYMNKYGKKWGVKVEDMRLPQVEFGLTMHSVPVTETMKQSVMEGQPMFYKTPNGTVYGWTDGKKIYLTKAGINPNTPIHEYTHLWAKAMMQKNQKGWNRIKQLLKGTPVWNEVMNDANYSDIHGNEDAVASEVLSRISGSENAAKMERMAQKMLNEAKGTARKLEARGLIQNMKDALNMFWEFVWTDLFKMTYFRNVEHVTDRVLFDLLNQTDLGEFSEGQVETQIVTDPEVIAELEASPKVAGFRNVVQNEDGTFSSPMAYWLQSTKEGAKSRVETAKFELGKWEEAEEHPELVDDNGKVTLVKPNKSTVDGVAYDPYIHNRLEPVNLQFKDAWKRDDLVYVETEVAENDLNDGYHADKALLPVGIHSWSNGDVMLSRYDKPVRIMPWEEVADAWAKRLNGEGVHFDVVPPAMRSLLVERGVEILPPHKGMGKNCNDAYQAWKSENNGEILSRKGEKNTTFAENNESSNDYERESSARANIDGEWKADSKGVANDTTTSLETIGGRSDIRVFEEGLESSRSSHSDDSERARREAESERLVKIAKENGLFIPIKETENLGEKVHKKTGESTVYINEEAGEVYKVKDPYAKAAMKSIEPEDAIREHVVHNILFPETAYSLKGISEEFGEVRLVLSQKFISANQRPTRERVVDVLESKGIYPESKYTFGNDYISVIDVEGDNVLLGEDGTVYFIDPIIKFKKPANEVIEFLYNEYLRSQNSNIQNASIDNLVGEPRLRAIEHAVNAEAAKLGVKVTYKTREEMPAGHKNDKGYYNTTTGEIVICTENASSIADAIQTILHETVAHKGLRQLMGDKFNEFINRVYNSLDADTKAAVDKLAADDYDGNTLVAMEEYMASLAENENFKEQTIWEKIKTIFNNVINKILGRNDIKLGDNELRYLLRASYNNMVNPKGMQTLEGWAKDMMMRENYGINEVNASTPEILSRTGVDPTEVAATSARQVYDRVVSDNWNEFQRQFQDAYQPVRVAIDAIQAETGNIPIEDYENYLLAQNQSSSRSRVEIDNFQRKYYSPIIKQVNKIIDDIMQYRGWDKKDKKRRAEVYQELRQYIIAKHGLERNAYYQNTKGEMRDFAGLTGLFGLPFTDFQIAETMAQDLVDNFEAMIGDAARDALWDKINSATDKTLRHSYESGLISRQQYNDIKAMFDFYVPLRGFDETTAEDVYAYARFEGNRFNPAVQTAKGRTSVADDPIAIIMNMAESEIAQGNKNRAKQALYNYLLNRATANNGQNSLMQLQDVWFTITYDAFGNQVYQIAAPNFAAGETYEQFEARMQALEASGLAMKSKKGKVDVGMRFQKPTHSNAHYVYLKINGVDKAIFINGDPKAADAINGAFQQKKMFGEDKMRSINRFISSTFTNYSLEFTARNYFRDMFYSHINIGVRESDHAYRKKFRQNWRRNNLGSMIKMLTAYRSGEFDSRALTADEAAFVEFMNNGGQTGYTLINSVEAHKKDLQNAIERMQKGVDKGGVKDSTVFKFTLGAIELLNEASELVTRFAAFKTSRDMGRSVETAISDAKEITVNFNTKGAQDGTGFMGAVARYFGWSKYFFNASVQGVQNIKAMAEANKLKFCGVVGGMIATGFGMPILTSLIFEMLGGGDDEEYWNIPEYDRQNNLCIALGNGKYVKIPLPIGFREVYAIGDMVAAMLMDKKFSRDFMQVGTDIANKISSVVLPVNPLESSANGLSIMHSVAYVAAPSSAQFVIQELSNTDWKGAPLQKEYTYNENDPQWMKAYASNPEWMVMLSKWCNEHIGAGDMKGWDWSPEKLDNRLSSLLGGVYTLIKKSGRSISMIWNEEQRNLSNVPLVGVALGSGIDSDDRFVTDAYFDMKKYYDERIGFIERRAKKFGLTLEDVFVNMEGGHHPKMQEVYSKDNFDFMQEWYLGNKALEDKKNKIEREEKRAAKEGLEPENNMELAALQNEFEAERRDFVNDMLELD